MAEITKILLPSDEQLLLESCRKFISNRFTDSLLFNGCDAYDNKILLFLVRRQNTIRTFVYLKLNSEQIYYSGTHDNSSSSLEWHSKCIKAEFCQPMGSWRVSYNGLLRNAISGENNHVKMNFLWHPISSTVYYDKSGLPLLELQKVAQTQISEELVCNLLQGYEQWGTFHGTVALNEQVTELNLISLKKRNWTLCKKDAIMLTTYSKNGMLININSVINSCSGHARTLRKHFCISECDFQYPVKIIPEMSFSISDGKSWYRIETEVSLNTAVISENLHLYNVTSNIEGVNGSGLLLFFKRFKKYDMDKDLPVRVFPALRFSNDLMINLESVECQNSTLTGEKAASLAKIIYSMNFFPRVDLTDCISIPKGICVTVNAMDLCMRQNEDLKCSLNVLKYGLHELPNSQLEPLCHKIQKLWTLARMDVQIINTIEQFISSQKLYAVRSSGILEDSVDVSAAGQSDTFLAVEGIANIVNAIKKCWASVYSFQSVHYRRDHGLPLFVKLGVIIQEMIATEIHGIVFTCHPISNDPRQISITYAFGERATVDGVPTSTVLVDKSNFEEVVYSSMGVEGREIPDLPSPTIDAICKISLQLEDLFSYPVDIEWGINNGQIYLLQCRPITTMFTWTDFEISHELDSGFTDFDAITFHNCGEITPDVTSPLSVSFNNRIMEEAFQLVEKHPSTEYHRKLLSVTHYRIAMNICNGLLLQVNREIPFFQKIIDVIVCGQVITTDSLYALAQKRNGIAGSFSSILKLITSIKLIWGKNKSTEEAVKIANQFTIDSDEFNSAELLLEHIIEQAPVLQKVAEYHLNVSSASNILKAAVLSLMCKDDEENLQSHVTNLSWYLSNCDQLVSAGVPKSLMEISRLLRDHENKSDYLSVDTRYKCDWMQKNCPEAWIRTKNFFEKHGARCVKEADLMTETWSMNSDSIFECIDLLIKSDKFEMPINLIEYTRQENIASSQNYGRIIKWLMESCKNAVISREKTKQCFILILHQFRLAFCRLGTLLAEDAIISNANSVFYYTFYELHQLVNGKNRQAIMHKGQRRYRVWSQLKRLKFEDVIFGIPKPIKIEPEPILEEIFSLQGTSVSFHSSIGRARVVCNIKEAKDIENGEILVMHCVDIGWSPYFPILSGLITELGGLMSHGAIIARECGLPCVIGVKDATAHIKTGDTVEINGPNGIITRLKSSSD
ncbi:rifampicin phosphotransferase-like [Planococcus citri]|uniref:rifampicin phosphotransferase-like n=1 Tax=Planococcus citri TaxID=170843 RepID=UPI0031F7EA84